MRPDIALISPYPRSGTRHDGASGVASYTANLAHSLTAAGLHTAVVAPHDSGEPARHLDGNVDVRRAFSLGGAAAVPQALAAARATGAPVVHLQHELFLYGGPAASAGLFRGLAARSEVPTVVTMHQVVDPAGVTADFARMHRITVPSALARAGVSALQRALPKLADATVVHEHAFQPLVPGSRVIAHGIEQADHADAAARARARAALGLPEGRFVVLCFGFVAPYKGLEIALDAATLAGEDVLLVVAGGEHPRLAAQGDDYLEKLRAHYAGVARFTGFVGNDDVASWFHAADLALYPYPAPHASSGALALGLAHGTPSLMSPRLAATCGADPVLCCPLDAVSLAAHLRTLARDPERVDRLRVATDTLLTDRSWPHVAREHVRIYQEVARAESPARRRLRAA